MKAYQYTIREKKANEALRSSYVEEIDISIAKKYILEYEWLGKMPGWTRYCFGHFFTSVCDYPLIGGVLILGDTTGSNIAFNRMCGDKKVIQLQRGVNLWWTPMNSASFFISRVCKWLKENTDYSFVTATCDEEAGEIGTIYQSLNWLYVGKLKHGHPKFLLDGKEIHPKTLYDKHKTSSVLKIKEIYGDRIETKKANFKHRYIHPIRGDKIPFFADSMTIYYPKR